MKKLFIVCLSLILLLTSCDIDYINDWINPQDTEEIEEKKKNEEAEEPELPRSEAYTLSELVNVDDIAYVQFTVDYYLSSSIPRPYITDNVDSFLSLLQNDESSDLQFIADIEDVYDLCNKLLYESFDFSRNGDCYVIYYLLDCEKHTIAHGTIYCNNYINVFVSETDTLYCSESPANIDLESLIDSINAKKL